MMSIKTELKRARKAIARLDRQTVVVLVVAGLLVFAHRLVGSRELFRSEIAGIFPEYWQGVLAWAWWFAIQGVTGFVIPVLILVFLFKRKPASIGLGLGDTRFALTALLVYLPIVVVGTWVLSDGADFQAMYPHYGGASRD